MRKIVIALAAAGSALVLASPASAQYYPQPQPYGQAYGYNGYNGYNGYGHGGYGQVQQLQQRIDALQNRIRWMDRTNVIRDRSANRLKDEARDIEKRLRRDARYGLNPYELNSLQTRIARLEQRVQFAGGNRYGRGGYGYNGGYNNGGYSTDHDRDDDHRGHDDWNDDRDD
jgi:opacity protein-like surface antigen